jgi:Protein of unknown function (DUF2793)
MAKTAQLSLPLLMPAQAQKHVTVNEALARLDALTQMRVVSSETPVPPALAVDGTSYLVPAGASGAWDGMAGRIAVWSNGGWVFLVPKAGWSAWDEGRGGRLVFDGVGWAADAVAVSAHGAGIAWKVLEFDHAVTAGASNLTSVLIPDRAQVVGVTGRVVAALAGSGLASWRVGVAGSDNRYGSGLGIALNSFLVGLSGSPVTYYSPTPLLLTAEGGSFASGTLRLAVHFCQIEPPRPV